jgi:DNA-binding transcriptional LysR family regulator
MEDLNDLAYFVKVVDHHGFAPASRALGMHKSKLSRRIAALEDRLGVRLIQRSSRRFAVTEIGQTYYTHCLAMLVEAEAAQQSIDQATAEPLGLVRMACPPGLLAYRMGESIAEFMARYPKVEIQLKAYNRPVDVIAEGYDLVISNQTSPFAIASLAMRKLGEISQLMVAAPELVAKHGAPRLPTDLRSFPAVGMSSAPTGLNGTDRHWKLVHADGAIAEVPFAPSMMTDDLTAARMAALAGIGAACMPDLLIAEDLQNGRLVELLPEWRAPNIPVFATFPSRRGILPSVRALLDHLAGECAPYRTGTNLTHGAS